MEACLIFSSFATKDLNLQEMLFDRGCSDKFFGNLFQL